MIDDQDVRDAFARMVAAGPPAPSSAAAVRLGRRTRQRRTLLTTGATAAGVAAVVVAASAVSGFGGGGSTAVATPAPAPTAAPDPVVPGISPARARAIATACTTGYRGNKWTPAATARLRLYNTGPTPWGTRYLFYGPTEYLDCLHTTEGDYRADGLAGHQTRWLRGPLSADRAITDGQPYDRGPGTFTGEGRVGAAVTTVEITYGLSTLRVPVRNGTFVTAMTVSVQDMRTGRPTFRALDADGRVVADPAPSPAPAVDERCWVTPDGTVLKGDVPPAPGQKCLPATPWR